jgi:uncharacterized coiled-coil DUF342 family protein
MRLINIILMLFITACTEGVGQKTSEEMKKEAEFQEIMRKVNEQRNKNHATIKAADEKTSQTIQKTAEKIVTLKQEVNELKQEINETNIKSGNAPKFKFLPISDSTDN